MCRPSLYAHLILGPSDTAPEYSDVTKRAEEQVAAEESIVSLVALFLD